MIDPSDDSNNNTFNTTASSSSTSFDLGMNSRRGSQDDSLGEASLVPEITAEEIERLMMFDMMRKNFKNESDFSAFD
jgi:hypothetical protein